ncbi:TPA: hypothetical protein H1V22_004597 [Salmonella enterica]|nr:hypothetical protein [Salmonella enterica]
MMKHNVMLISSLALAIMSGSAMANINGGEIQFSGSVSSTTCDIQVLTASGQSNTVELGNAEPGASFTPINFTLQPATACNVLSGGSAAPGTQALVSFTGPFDNSGIKPTYGEASDARLKLKSTNSVTQGQEITKTKTNTIFTMEEFNKGAGFTAELVPGTKTGDWHTSLAYVVTYK